MKIIKATDNEKIRYDKTNPVHGLFGWVNKNGQRIPVEYLGEGLGEPNYEAVLPGGFRFYPDGTTTLLGTTQQDLIERLGGNVIEPGEGL